MSRNTTEANPLCILSTFRRPHAAPCCPVSTHPENCPKLATFSASFYSPHQNLPDQRSRPSEFSSTRLMGKQVTINNRYFPPIYPINIFWPVTSIWISVLWAMSDILAWDSWSSLRWFQASVTDFCLPGSNLTRYSFLVTHTGLVAAIPKCHVFSSPCLCSCYFLYLGCLLHFYTLKAILSFNALVKMTFSMKLPQFSNASLLFSL